MRIKMDRSVLEMALLGYQAELNRIMAKMTAIRTALGSGKLGGGDVSTPFAIPTGTKHHYLTAAARKRIAAAQKKRWAQYRAQKKPAPPTGSEVALKRKLSTAIKAKPAANLAKARAAKVEKAAAATA